MKTTKPLLTLAAAQLKSVSGGEFNLNTNGQLGVSLGGGLSLGMDGKIGLSLFKF